MKIDPITAPWRGEGGRGQTRHLSDAGGLTQFGACIQMLPPGVSSSDRHWHEAEDEFLMVLEGVATVVDDDGAHLLLPGDAACWRHGDPNAHHVQNRSDAPLHFVIVGSRVAEDVCHYPDSGRKLVNSATEWQVLDAAGACLRGGDLPPQLLNLAPVWGTPFDATVAMPRILHAASRSWMLEDTYTHPVCGGGLGPYSHSVLGDPGGLSQFGVHLEELPPGSKSSFRHWHETEDEMILMLSGKVVLVEDAETALLAGDVACWPAGQPVGHCLENRSDQPARYLTIGTRHIRDVIHYSGHDLITHKDGPARHYFHRDSTPYPDRRKK